MSEENARYVLDGVRRLLGHPVGNLEQLNDWNAAADDVERQLREHSEDLEERDFHEIQHYLLDSNLRLRDEKYRVFQESQMREILGKYEPPKSR